MARLLIVWIHVVAAAAWLGGLLYASHLVVPALARGERPYLALLRRGRVVQWAAFGLVSVTGLDNLRRVGLASPWLAGKLLLVIALLAFAAHRDFAALPRAAQAIEAGEDAGRALAGLRWLDRVTLVLALGIVFLAVGVARGR